MVMSEEKFECPECSQVFSTEETLKEHSQMEHGKETAAGKRLPSFSVKTHLKKSFGTGMLLGILLSSAVFSGYLYWDSMDHRTEVPVTVVTCEECEWSEFRESTDRIFKASYREVDYQSEEGQELIEKYNLKYVPGFIFDREKIEQAENFTKVEPTLVKSEDAYVIPDEGIETAQRLSEGKPLDN